MPDEFSKRWNKIASTFLSALAGEETKSLVGNVEYGEPTGYQVKQIVIAIKQLARSFAEELGDEHFSRAVEKAMDNERAVMKRRFGVKAGVE